MLGFWSSTKALPRVSSFLQIGEICLGHSLPCLGSTWAGRKKYSSHVEHGTMYEELVVSSLQNSLSNVGGLELERCGRTGDQGLDFIGQWDLPSGSSPLFLFGQCKSSKRSIAPQFVRELDGASAQKVFRIKEGQHILSSSSSLLKEEELEERTLCFLVGSSGFTQQSLKAFRAVQRPMCLIHMDWEGDILSVCFCCFGFHFSKRSLLHQNYINTPIPKKMIYFTPFFYYYYPKPTKNTTKDFKMADNFFFSKTDQVDTFCKKASFLLFFSVQLPNKFHLSRG